MTTYVLPNRIGYIDYIQNQFHPSKIKDLSLNNNFIMIKF